VPADVRTGGVLKVGGEAAYAPMENEDNGTISGFDVDLTRAIAQKLNLKFQYSNIPWDDLQPGLADHKIDVIASSMTDTAERQKDRDFVDYLNAGTQLVVRSGNPSGVTGLDNACGLRLAYQTDTVQADQVKIIDQQCRDAGKPGVVMVETASSDDPLASVNAGTSDAAMVDFPVAADAVTHGGVQLAGLQVEAAPYGLALNKGSNLLPAVQAGLRAVMHDGTYDQLLKKWGITAGSLKTAARNGGA
jgi:polar amino acid transport system substrate-binding protein